ncbi:MAG: Gldg family protein [Promethearchaeota archaeon]
MEKPENTICFDYSHHNTLSIESPSNADFTQFLFTSSFRLGKIQAGFTDIEKLKKYNLVVIGGPRESNFSPEEIKVIVEYVRKGGNLLVFHNEGGDYGTRSNLSELTQFFGFRYKNNIMFDSVNFKGQQSRIIVKDFEPHSTTARVGSLVLSSACSIEKDELIAADQNITVLPLAKSSINAYCTEWDGEEWIEEMDAWNSIMGVYSKVYKGRVIGLSTVAMLSSLSSAYGFFAMNNQEFIVNIFKFLLEPPESEEGVSRDNKLITLPINYNLLMWMEETVNTSRWKNVSELIHYSIHHLKSNYDELMMVADKKLDNLFISRWKQLEILEKVENPVEREKKARIMEQEITMLNLSGYTHQTVMQINEIMKKLSEITAGKVGGNFSEAELKDRLQVGKEKLLGTSGGATFADESDQRTLSLSEKLTARAHAISTEYKNQELKVETEMKDGDLLISIDGRSLEKILADLTNTKGIQEKISVMREEIKDKLI